MSSPDQTAPRRRRFEDKVVFISGVARGQGRNHAIRFAEEGARVIGFDICEDLPNTMYPLATEEDLAETVRQVEAVGGAMHAEVADARDLGAVRRVLDAGMDRYGRLDVIVANAGIYALGPVRWLTDEAWDEAIDTNLTGVFNTVRAGVNRMVKQDEGGSIVITSSIAGLKGMYGGAAYNASKHGVVGFMKSIALELAPNRIRVNTVHPTSVYTPMIINDVFPRLVRSELDDPGEADAAEFLVEQQALDIPWVEVDDITNAIMWLSSDEARYITGITMPIDAGALGK